MTDYIIINKLKKTYILKNDINEYDKKKKW